MLIVLGCVPAVSGFVQHIPEPVLGANARNVWHYRRLRCAYRFVSR
ncbi:hypothetical protein ACLB1Q_22460 [Escherichia coli]